MLKKRELIKETISVIEKLGVSDNEKLIQALRTSLLSKIESGVIEPDSTYCELPMSNDELNRLVEILFDIETDLAPKGLGVGFEEDARRGRDAKNIARIVNEWNVES